LIVLDRYLDQRFDWVLHYDSVVASLEQQGFALLTENEWEYLCGAGTKRIFGDHVDGALVQGVCSGRHPWVGSDEVKGPTQLGV
jgi:hypothetical protein